jgi:hypothetical protein
MGRLRLMARRRTDGAGKIIDKDPEQCFRIPVFKDDICNRDTPDEMIVQRADNKVFNIIRAYRPITRWLLNTGWFDGPKRSGR